MVDIDTFLTTLYVMADDFAKSHLLPETSPGPEASLSRSEVITLALFGQWTQFRGERDFYAWAERHLRSAFPTLPDRSQFNRLMRHHADATIAFDHYLTKQLTAQDSLYEALDGMGVAIRDAKRRGEGWLAGLANIGWCNRLGWYEGVHVLTAVTPRGVITGYGFAPASTKEQPLAETFLAARALPHPHLPEVGRPAQGWYVGDKGFMGVALHQHWQQAYGARFVSPPKRTSPRPWPKWLRRWLFSIRQIVETVHDKLLNMFRLARERPHSLSGFRARLAAKVALHNFCIWLNRQLGRPDLAFADLIAW
jgi:hypothetical protein